MLGNFYTGRIFVAASALAGRRPRGDVAKSNVGFEASAKSVPVWQCAHSTPSDLLYRPETAWSGRP
jgi:hypothetical protein